MKILFYILALFLAVLIGWMVTLLMTGYNLAKNIVITTVGDFKEFVADPYAVFCTAITGFVTIVFIALLIHIAKAIRRG